MLTFVKAGGECVVFTVRMLYIPSQTTMYETWNFSVYDFKSFLGDFATCMFYPSGLKQCLNPGSLVSVKLGSSACRTAGSNTVLKKSDWNIFFSLSAFLFAV